MQTAVRWVAQWDVPLADWWGDSQVEVTVFLWVVQLADWLAEWKTLW